MNLWIQINCVLKIKIVGPKQNVFAIHFLQSRQGWGQNHVQNQSPTNQKLA